MDIESSSEERNQIIIDLNDCLEPSDASDPDHEVEINSLEENYYEPQRKYSVPIHLPVPKKDSDEQSESSSSEIKLDKETLFEKQREAFVDFLNENNADIKLNKFFNLKDLLKTKMKIRSCDIKTSKNINKLFEGPTKFNIRLNILNAPKTTRKRRKTKGKTTRKTKKIYTKRRIYSREENMNKLHARTFIIIYENEGDLISFEEFVKTLHEKFKYAELIGLSKEYLEERCFMKVILQLNEVKTLVGDVHFNLEIGRRRLSPLKLLKTEGIKYNYQSFIFNNYPRSLKKEEQLIKYYKLEEEKMTECFQRDFLKKLNRRLKFMENKEILSMKDLLSVPHLVLRKENDDL